MNNLCTIDIFVPRGHALFCIKNRSLWPALIFLACAENLFWTLSQSDLSDSALSMHCELWPSSVGLSHRLPFLVLSEWEIFKKTSHPKYVLYQCTRQCCECIHERLSVHWFFETRQESIALHWTIALRITVATQQGPRTSHSINCSS